LKELLKREVGAFVQYCLIAFVAGLLHFYVAFVRIPHINLTEAWKGYSELLWIWLLLFAALGAVRLPLVLFLGKK
jgi:hypothetical protein